MNRISIINYLIGKHGYKKYLEIGCQTDECFKAIAAELKVGVDPERGGTRRETSDQFFTANTELFDIIFIDGLHTCEQVEKDIINALKFLTKNGTIVCHDMNPANELMQRVPRAHSNWTGDVWKTFVKLRINRPDLEMFVIDCDYGVGIIKRGFQTALDTSLAINYENLEKNRKHWLNLITTVEFLKK